MCNREVFQLKKCPPPCGNLYCGKECQAKDWNSHKKNCPNMTQKVPARYQTNTPNVASGGHSVEKSLEQTEQTGQVCTKTVSVVSSTENKSEAEEKTFCFDDTKTREVETKKMCTRYKCNNVSVQSLHDMPPNAQALFLEYPSFLEYLKNKYCALCGVEQVAKLMRPVSKCVKCGAEDPRGRSNSTPIVCFSCAKSVFNTDTYFREYSMSTVQNKETKFQTPYKNLANNSVKHPPKQCEGCNKQSSTYLPPYRFCVECRFTDCYKARENRFEFFFNLCFCGFGFPSSSPHTRQCDWCDRYVLDSVRFRTNQEDDELDE